MKLFHKIFLCFVVIFGITFQAAGYLLINFSYKNAVEQEKEIAFQDFKYNQYILQSILYSDTEFILKEKNESILRNFTVPVNLYGRSGGEDFWISGIPMLKSSVNDIYDSNRWEIYRINKDKEEQVFLNMIILKKERTRAFLFRHMKKMENVIFLCLVVSSRAVIRLRERLQSFPIWQGRKKILRRILPMS